MAGKQGHLEEVGKLEHLGVAGNLAEEEGSLYQENKTDII